MSQITVPAGFVETLSKKLEKPIWIAFQGSPPFLLAGQNEKLPIDATIYFPPIPQSGTNTQLTIFSGDIQDEENLEIIARLPLSKIQDNMDQERGYPLFFHCDIHGLISISIKWDTAVDKLITENLDQLIKNLLNEGNDIFQITAQLADLGINRDLAMNMVLLLREETRGISQGKPKKNDKAPVFSSLKLIIPLVGSLFFSIAGGLLWIFLAEQSGQQLLFMSCAIGLASGLGFNLFSCYYNPENITENWAIFTASLFAFIITILTIMTQQANINWHQLSISQSPQASARIDVPEYIFNLPNSITPWLWATLSGFLTFFISSPNWENDK